MEVYQWVSNAWEHLTFAKRSGSKLTIEIGREVVASGTFSNFHCAPEIFKRLPICFADSTAPEPIEQKPS